MAKKKANGNVTIADIAGNGNEKVKVMKTETAEIKRTVKHPDGTEIERKANVVFASPENNDDAAKFFGDNMWKWALEGYTEYLKSHVRMKLGGGGDSESDGRSDKLLRQFNSAIQTFVDVEGEKREEVFNRLINRERFSSLKAKFDAMKDTSDQNFDFTSGELPTPKWFSSGEKKESESENENADATENSK